MTHAICDNSSDGMAVPIPSLDALQREAIRIFEDNFNSFPEVGISAPGRVNLIGEHVDYNDGFVLPMALPLMTVIVGSKARKNKCCVVTNSSHVDGCQKVEFYLPSADNPLTPGQPKWLNYIKGVMANFKGELCAFDAAVVSSVPVGGGLSSSAALEVATYTFLEQLTDTFTNELKEKALACQKAEHDFAKMPCGIMDQFISVMGRKDNALLIDCRSLEAQPIPLRSTSVVFIIINSNVRHELTGSEYPSRRKLCEDAAKLMNKKSLRDATLEELENYKDSFSNEMYRRVLHVISEIQRTKEAASAIEKNDFVQFGNLMKASHYSLRDNYEVSCAEVDQLVEAALQVDGVYGSRMTGGGFGGCTVTLIEKSCVDKLIEHIEETYTGNPTFYVCSPDNGASVLFKHL